MGYPGCFLAQLSDSLTPCGSRCGVTGITDLFRVGLIRILGTPSGPSGASQGPR